MNNNNNNLENTIIDIINNWKKGNDSNKPEKYKKIYNFFKKDKNDQDIKDEDKIMLTSSQESPFISYKEFNDIAINAGYIDKSLTIPRDIYNISKLLYQNPTNKEIIIDIGKSLYQSGGKKIMRLIYNILTIFYHQYDDPVIYGQPAFIDICWTNFMKDWKYN